MIDTVKIELMIDDPWVLQGFEYSKVYDFNEEKEYHNCRIRNLKVTCTKKDDKYKIQIIGSLHKFLHGYNLSRFTLSDVQKAIKLLTEIIGVDISKGVVKRVDVGANISVDNNPTMYHLLLFAFGHSKRDTYSDNQTVNFRGNGIALSFYDKRAEIKKDKEAKKQYASFISAKNIIRYELKLTKKLQKHLYLPNDKLYVRDLYERAVYAQLIDLWYNNYRAVIKNLFYRSPDVYENFNDYLKNEGIKNLGGITNAFQILDSWCIQKGIDRQKKYTIKRKIKNEYRKLNPTNRLIKELNRKIKFEKEFYL